MQEFKRIYLIVNPRTLVITVLAVISTYLCLQFRLTADFPLTLIATAVVFPIVFSIGGAYKRREAALQQYGGAKAHGRAIYFAAPLDEMVSHEERVYAEFSRLSRFIRDDLRRHGLATGEVSRCNQYLSKMLMAFENVKHIYQYRTPRTLCSFNHVFIAVLPPLYGPYFAHVARDYAAGLSYVMPVLFAVILVSLDNIQTHLENPFDQVGEDDVVINAEEFVARLEL